MSYLEVDGITRAYGSGFALREMGFVAEKGEIVALLGPSGCGKTTLLNVLAGFLVPDSGTIRVAGRDITRLPTRKRDMAMVFQSYALFPHLTITQNIAFGLEARGVPRAERPGRIAAALDLVRLAETANRYPAQLSGGQQQRIAIARAIAVHPALLLLDEPLSNLDTLLRKDMREELRAILQRTQTTAVLVTHDQEEALAVADQLVVIHAGRIDQVGPPRTVFERPRTVFAARFLEATNLIAAHSDSTGLVTAFGPVKTAGPPTDRSSAVTLMLRPDRLRVVPVHSDANGLTGQLEAVTYLGTINRVHVRVAGLEIVVHAPVSTQLPQLGHTIHIAWQPEDQHVIHEALDTAT